MNCSPANLASQAACYKSCLSPGSIAAIKNYLLCAIVNVGGIGANLIPTGASYSGGCSYSLAISPNTTYAITWGANDTSATVGSTSYPSTGASTQTTFYSSSNTTITFFGTGGSTVTAMLRVAPKDVPILSGLSLAPTTAGQLTVSWDTPPSQITSTSVYTSPDQVTWTLAATLAAPTSSTTINAAAVGSNLYVRGYWTNGIATNTLNPITKAYSGRTPDWLKRIIANGGASPASGTLSAVETFEQTLLTNNLDSLFVVGLLVVPDNLTAAITPFWKRSGNDPWTNHSFVAGDLTINGLAGDGASKYLDVGATPAGLLSVIGGTTWASAGISLYIQSGNNLSQYDVGAGDSALQTLWGLAVQSGTAQYDAPYGTSGQNRISYAQSNFTGFLSGNRTGTSTNTLYAASSTRVFGSIATGAQNVSGAPTDNTGNMVAWALNNAGTIGFWSSKRISFVAHHAGFSSSQCQTLYNAVQALRTALGGGWV